MQYWATSRIWLHKWLLVFWLELFYGEIMIKFHSSIIIFFIQIYTALLISNIYTLNLQKQQQDHRRELRINMNKIKIEEDQANMTQSQELLQNNNFQLIKSKKNFTVAVRLKPQSDLTQFVKPKINKLENVEELSFINNYGNISAQNVVEKTSKQINCWAYGQKNKQFKFDKVFDENQDNKVIFETLIKNKIQLLQQRLNLSIMAYGATNSGKTYTVFGNKEKQCEGLASHILKYILNVFDSKDYKFQFSYLQIYNECINDLLDENIELPIKSLQIMEDQDGNTNVIGLRKVKVQQYAKIQELMEKGNNFRRSCNNNVNTTSSRSHAIMELQITKISTNLKSKLTILDLAGSQKYSHVGSTNNNSSILLKEGSNINKSLLSLGNCIKNLQQNDGFIPYRDSKLTRLLKQNLNGYSHNIMIACITQNFNQFQQNINSLNYASKAMKIQRKLQQKQQKQGLSSYKCENCSNNLKNQEIKNILAKQRQSALYRQKHYTNRRNQKYDLDFGPIIIKNRTEVEQLQTLIQLINKQIDQLGENIAKICAYEDYGKLELNGLEFKKTKKNIQTLMMDMKSKNQLSDFDAISKHQVDFSRDLTYDGSNFCNETLNSTHLLSKRSTSKDDKKKIKISLGKTKATPQSHNDNKSKILAKISKFQQSSFLNSDNRNYQSRDSSQSQTKKNPQNIQVNISCFKNLTVNIHTSQAQLFQQRQKMLKQRDRNLNLGIHRNKDKNTKDLKSFKNQNFYQTKLNKQNDFRIKRTNENSMLDSNNFTQRMKRDQDEDVDTWKNIIIKKIQSAKKTQSQSQFDDGLFGQNESFVEQKFKLLNV